jgi:hypothetical protein
MYNFSIAGTRDNTAEKTLSPSDVGGLQVLWNFPTKGVVAGTPAVVDDVVYAGDTSGTFYALSRDGKLLWQTQVDGPVTDSPLVTGHTVIFGTLGNAAQGVAGSIYGLDTETGKVRWRTEPNTSRLAEIFGSATKVGDDVAIGVATGEEFVATPPRRAARWSCSTPRTATSSGRPTPSPTPSSPRARPAPPSGPRPPTTRTPTSSTPAPATTTATRPPGPATP